MDFADFEFLICRCAFVQLYFWIVWLLLEENNRNKNAKLKIKKQEKTQKIMSCWIIILMWTQIVGLTNPMAHVFFS